MAYSGNFPTPDSASRFIEAFIYQGSDGKEDCFVVYAKKVIVLLAHCLEAMKLPIDEATLIEAIQSQGKIIDRSVQLPEIQLALDEIVKQDSTLFFKMMASTIVSIIHNQKYNVN